MTQQTGKLPTNNRFLPPSAELAERARQNLVKELGTEIWVLSLPGQGEAKYVNAKLRDIQKVLAKFQEFGYDVLLLDEKSFPELVEAIGVMKRGGLEGEIKSCLDGLLAQCRIPYEKTQPAFPVQS